jgi:predicted naringenin-chalcone synthase
MALATPAIDYAYYPTLGVVGAPSAIAVALAGLGCLAGAAAALRRTAAGAVPA